MGEDLHLSPSESAHESTGQTQDLQRDSSHSSASMAKEQLVPIGVGTQTQTGAPSTSGTDTSSTAQICLRTLLNDEQITFASFLQLSMGLSLGLSPSNVQFREISKRVSTRKQYQSDWKKWMCYVRKEKPSEITIDFCFSFLRHLHDMGLASSTITSIKSALTKPLEYGFGISLNNDIFNKVPLACANLRPDPPP